jgi:hypothetical protein
MFAEIWIFRITVSALACAAIFSNRDRNPWGGALLGVLLGFIGILVAALLFRSRPTATASLS